MHRPIFINDVYKYILFSDIHLHLNTNQSNIFLFFREKTNKNPLKFI